MIRILANDKISDCAVNNIKNLGYELTEHHYSKEELLEEIGNYHAIIVRSATKLKKDLIDAGIKGKLSLIIRAGVGLDNIDVEYAESKGIEVLNTPNASSSAVAELAIGQMFALSRHIYISNVTMRDGQWNKKLYKGVEVNGKTLGIIGFGRIGQEVAKRAHALGMSVLYNTRSGEKSGFEEYKYVSLEELIQSSDIITLHVPFIKEKGAFLGKAEFEQMKDGVMIINTARGGVINEDALLEALDSGKVAAAAIDVFEKEPLASEEIMSHDKISLTPHIGASTHEAQDRIGEEIYDRIKKHFDNEEEVYVHC